MHLKNIPVGRRGRITGYKKGEKEYRRRLLMLGATPGVEFEVVRIAPLGDPIELTVRGYELSIRKDEAASIEVTNAG